jgi:low affinity Fe/Cu permease
MGVFKCVIIICQIFFSCKEFTDRIVCVGKKECMNESILLYSKTLDGYLNRPLSDSEVDELPTYLKAMTSGGLIYNDGNGIEFKNGNQKCYYNLSSTKESDIFMIFFCRVTQINDSFSNTELLDYRIVNAPKKNLTIAYQTCEKNKSIDSRIIALVENENVQYFEPPLVAWMANIQKLMLEQTPIESIRCANEGW